jgi:hypothetical protein
MEPGEQLMMKQLKRRTLLMGIAPTVIAGSKSGSRKPILGDGEFRYEVNHDWGQLPSKIRWGNTHGIAQDSQGFIYINHSVHADSPAADSLVVFDPKGKFVRSGSGEFRGGAHGLTIHKQGGQEFLYFVDTGKGRPDNRVVQQHACLVKMTLRGEEVMRIGYPEESPEYAQRPVFSPTNVVIADNGDIYLADGYGANFINQYDSRGRFIRSFGGSGKEPGQFVKPHGLTIDKRSSPARLLVADRSNHRLQYFSMDGKFLEVQKGAHVNLPCHFDERGGVLLVPDLGARVSLLNRDNQLIAHLGDDSSSDWRKTRLAAREAFQPGKFVSPHAAMFDRDGNIFVVEWVEVGRVTKLRHVH